MKRGWALFGALAISGGIAAVVAAVLGRRTDEPSSGDLATDYPLEQQPFTGRSPQDILQAVAYVDPEGNPTLQRGYLGQPNWCNRFVHLVADYLRVPLIWGDYGTRANDMVDWLADGNADWFKVDSGMEAQALALQGFFVLATYKNWMPWNSGHIAVVLPHAGPVQIAQAGAHNYNHTTVDKGFGSIVPVYYAHA
jgi:hypothetical protein